MNSCRRRVPLGGSGAVGPGSSRAPWPRPWSRRSSTPAAAGSLPRATSGYLSAFAFSAWRVLHFFFLFMRFSQNQILSNGEARQLMFSTSTAEACGGNAAREKSTAPGCTSLRRRGLPDSDSTLRASTLRREPTALFPQRNCVRMMRTELANTQAFISPRETCVRMMRTEYTQNVRGSSLARRGGLLMYSAASAWRKGL